MQARLQMCDFSWINIKIFYGYWLALDWLAHSTLVYMCTHYIWRIIYEVGNWNQQVMVNFVSWDPPRIFKLILTRLWRNCLVVQNYNSSLPIQFNTFSPKLNIFNWHPAGIYRNLHNSSGWCVSVTNWNIGNHTLILV